MKRWLSAFIIFALLLTMVPMSVFAAKGQSKVFSDVLLSDYYAEAAESLAEKGILEGYPNGTFGADKCITRAEMAAIVCRLIDMEAEAKEAVGKTDYDDVRGSHWASGYINIASEEGIINGDGDGTFRPEDDVLYEEAIKMVVCALGYGDDVKVDPADWSAAYLKLADKKGISDNLRGKKGKAATRGDIAVMSYNGLLLTEEEAEPEIQVAMPTTSHASGRYSGSQSVVLKTATSGATIYYTINGSKPTEKSTKFNKYITISDDCTLKAVAIKDGVSSDVLTVTYTISRTVKRPSSTTKTYTVKFDLNYEGAATPEGQKVKDGEFAVSPKSPERSGFQFTGWYADKNESDWRNTFKFSETPITADITLYALWVDITTDTDGDGLADEVEEKLGTDKTKADTDEDGLNDFQEVTKTGTDPLKADTDENGINDFDEDADSDTLSNGLECSKGTNPVSDDTDKDTLKDGDEINVYGTDPLNEDTDGDGATDGWEISNNFDPKTKNSSFTATESSETVSESNPVAASVQINLNGDQIDTLSVTPVSVADNPYISESVPGYMGAAYDFEVEGTFVEATLTFEYDKALGTVGDDFQPRIYYFNETSKEFEELPNQTVENGKVSAKTTHFSTYILLNKVEFEEVWNTEIKPPLTEDDGSEASLDIAFVIDYSLSMDSNDPNKLFKSLSKEFVAKLRDGKDKAAVVKFIRRATLVSGLTADKAALNTAIDSIGYDNGYGTYSGTDGSTGYKMALDALSGSDAKYKYIIFITDGEDNGYTYSYDTLIAQSVENNVVVYTIGMGSASESVLRKVADGTNGKYYHATTGTASGEIIDLDSVFEDIEDETIDKTKDTNQDGLPDYYTELIEKGELVLSNGSDEFKDIDFNCDEEGKPSADYDGDGLKNGEELQIVYRGNKVFLIMKSNPLMKHSDGDGIDDKKEVANGTDPLVYQVNAGDANALLDDNNFYYARTAESFDTEWLFKADVGFLAAFFGVWNKDELYRDIMTDYFATYGDATYVENLEAEQSKKLMVETLSSLYSGVKNYVTNPASTRSKVSKIPKLISTINGTKDANTIKKLVITTYKEVVEEIVEINPELNKIKITSYTMKSGTRITVNMTELGKKVDKFFKGITYLSYAVDIADTINSFAKINANSQAFENNIDILKEIRDNSTDDHAKDAASEMINTLSKEYGSAIVAICGDLLEAGAKELISLLAKKNPYVLAIVAVRDIFDLVTGISQDVKQTYEILCYDRMSTAVIKLFNNIASQRGKAYYVSDENIEHLNRYLINLAQMRILGEKKFCQWQEYEGLLGLVISNEDVEKKIDEQIKGIKTRAGNMNLTLSTKL